MFRQLLVPLDHSPLAEQALGPAFALANASHAKIDLVEVHEPVPLGAPDDAPLNPSEPEKDEAYLEALVARFGAGMPTAPTHAVVRGEPSTQICRRAHAIDADLIVMTSHGRTGLGRAWSGSVADAVIRHCAVPVLMERPVEDGPADGAPRPIHRILVPLDGSALAAEILPPAARLARCMGAQIVLLRVVPNVPIVSADPSVPFAFDVLAQDAAATALLVDEARQQLSDVRRMLNEWRIDSVESHVTVSDSPAPEIIATAARCNADVIAMSTSGRGASRLIIGSVADKVIRGTRVPLLLFHPMVVGADLSVTPESVTEQLPALARG